MHLGFGRIQRVEGLLLPLVPPPQLPQEAVGPIGGGVVVIPARQEPGP